MQKLEKLDWIRVTLPLSEKNAPFHSSSLFEILRITSPETIQHRDSCLMGLLSKSLAIQVTHSQVVVQKGTLCQAQG